MAQKKELFVIIDANSLFHRAYHVIPRSFTTKKGELVNAVYGFSAILLRALKEFQPDYLVAAFDVAGPTFRDEEYEDYKATREKAPDELYEQIPRIKEVLNAFHIPIYEMEGFEADDVIGTVAGKVEKEEGIKTLVLTGDSDMLQLVGSRTNVYIPKPNAREGTLYTTRAFKDKFEFNPKQLVDYKGLIGDTSDNIPGVPQVGPVAATKLIKKHHSLEKIYKELEQDKLDVVTERIQKLLKENKEQAFFSRMLATIRLDVPIKFKLKDARWGGFTEEKVKELFTELSFKSLIPRLSDVRGFEQIDEEEETTSSPTARTDEMIADIEEAREIGILSDELYKLEQDLVPVIVSMEEHGIGIDEKALKELQKKVQKKLRSIEAKIYKLAGQEFNINSPKQLSEILFEKLEIDAKGLKKTPGKEISTAASEMEKLKERHPIAPLILEQRELQKLLTTYIIPLPKLKDETGRIHTTFNPFGAATGRLSSNKPNLQNIPIKSEFAGGIRKAFIAGKGKKFLACDYSQMELRVVAHLANDTNMINAFLNDEDIHVSTAARVFDIDLNKVTPDMRYRAKELNFGLIYGMGPTSFARAAKISLEEAREFTQRYMDIFEGVAAFMTQTKEGAYRDGYVETLFGRKRFLPDLQSPNPMIRAMAERAAINMPVQGTAADIVKMAMVASFAELTDIDLLLQIHDELLWEVPNAIIEERATQATHILEDIVELAVPLKVDYAIGTSWGSLKK